MLENFVELKFSFSKIVDFFVDWDGNIYCQLINKCYLDLKIEYFYYVGNLLGVVDGVVGLLMVLKEYVEK